ncbi:MAG TPA: CDP-diacylglycerol--glycerol-3-phosphate 3-phosphatidyltransferase, partial [Clostridium sp.]|nr:CDP-diacylglycerol--glycerol-3-phosphate 3-phosphatidyltransferase [Clostridium sp.]
NPSWINVVTQVTIYLAAIITVISGVDYFIKGKGIININK